MNPTPAMAIMGGHPAGVMWVAGGVATTEIGADTTAAIGIRICQTLIESSASLQAFV